MRKNRRDVIDVEATEYYHCMTRCVRRAFLCGEDRVTGQNFDHRKGWVVAKLRELAGVFCVEICAYAVMSNHLHVVLRIRKGKQVGLSEGEVKERWRVLFPGSVEEAEKKKGREAKLRVEVFRHRLGDISWFMRSLNEHIARRANKEDHCKGRFWEGRFKSQALLDEAALWTCMAYVDLNPVRAGLAESLEESDFTSIQQRLRERARKGRVGERGKEGQERGRNDGGSGPKLWAFWKQGKRGMEEKRGSCGELMMKFEDYVGLVRETGGMLAVGKRGRLSNEEKDGLLSGKVRRILREKGVKEEGWIGAVREFGRGFANMVGRVHSIRVECERQGIVKTWGSERAKEVFEEAV